MAYVATQLLDYGHAIGLWIRRGPFRQGVTVRTSNTRGRLPVARRRQAMRALASWARQSRTPRYRYLLVGLRRAKAERKTRIGEPPQCNSPA